MRMPPSGHSNEVSTEMLPAAPSPPHQEYDRQRVYQELHGQFDLTRLTDTDRSLPKGVVVLPIYLGQVIEFDSIIVNVSKTT